MAEGYKQATLEVKGFARGKEKKSKIILVQGKIINRELRM